MGYSNFLTFLAVSFSLVVVGCLNYSPHTSVGYIHDDFIASKQKGAHVFGSIDSSNILPFKESNYDWITLVPWGAQKDFDSKTVGHGNQDSSWIKKKNAEWLRQMSVAHEAGFKIFFKPHIWLTEPSEGIWRSEIFPSSEENWLVWKESYRDYIFRWARVAEEGKAEMFCMGTELTKLTLEKPEFWTELINDLRKIYSGKLIYAANWYQEYENISFWDKLDYIGVQAYFPLVDKKNPAMMEICEGWHDHLPSLEAIQKKFDKSIVFTEIGYKSTADSAIKPWEWLDYTVEENVERSEQTQANCYQAFFETVWTQPWFEGAHLWQFRCDFQKGVGKNDWDFTPQGKIAEQVIKEELSSKHRK